MRNAAEGSARKCWPNLGVLGAGRAADTFGTLTLFLSDDYTGLSSPRIFVRRMACSEPPSIITCAEAGAHILEGCIYAYCFCCLGMRAFFQDWGIGRRGWRFAASPGCRRTPGQRI